MYIRVISDYKCRGQLGQISGKCTYDTLAFSLRKSESATWCMLAATRSRRQEGSSHPSMASSVYESINRTCCIRTSVNHNILLVYRNQPERYRTAMICAKISASHYRAGFVLSAGTTNWKFIFSAECHIFSDMVTYTGMY